MKGKFAVFSLLLAAITLSCSNDFNYECNEPGVNLKTSAPYFAQDQYQVYNMFYKPNHGWVGDPMPFYKNGKFHIFYLQDTRPAPDTFHPWFCATTSDFLNYVDEGEMIPCGYKDSPEKALGTGSVIEHNGRYYAFYTAHNGDLGNDYDNPRERILMATSSNLKNWTKEPDFVLMAPSGYDRNEFRDPIIIKEDGKFKMLIATRADYKGSWRAVIARFASNDLYNWQLEEPIYDDTNTFILECPDVFTMGDYQYLLYSDINDNDRMVHYRYRHSGSSEWIVPNRSNLDGKAFYGGKTASDGTNRYVFAWCPTREQNQDDTNFNWGGSLIIHKLIQNQDGTLNVSIPQSIDDRFTNPKQPKVVSTDKQQAVSYTLSGAGDKQDIVIFDRLEKGISKISASIKPQSSAIFGFEFNSGGNREETYTITFNLAKQELQFNRILNKTNIVNRTKVSLPLSAQYDVKLIIENSVCLIYVNNQIAFTNRIYRMNQNAWAIFSNNGDVDFTNLNIYL